MNWWLVVLVVGLVLLSGFLGRVEGFHKGVQHANVSALMGREPERHPDKCQCGHNRSTHYDGKHHCVVAVEDSSCACRVFIGKMLKTPTAAGELDL